MLFAIQEINGNPDLLPNITLGFRIYNSCRMPQRALEGTMWLLSGQENPILNYKCTNNLLPAGVIGDSTSTRSILMARILGLYRHPQLSYSASSTFLSDRTQFPSFFRTIPSDDFQFRGMEQLVTYFGWTWVGILAEDSDYGQQGARILQEEFTKVGVCVAFSENILTSRADKNAFNIVQVVKVSTANTVAIISTGYDLAPVLDELLRQNVSGKVWISTEGWSTSGVLSDDKYSEILMGTIGFEIHSGEMLGFWEYRSKINPVNFPDYIYITEFWEEAFRCKWLGQDISVNVNANNSERCTGTEKLESIQSSLRDIISFRITYNIYTAVYVIALALQDLIYFTSKNEFNKEIHAIIMNFKPWQLLQYIRKVRLKRRNVEETFFDEHGNPPALYDIINWQRGPKGSIRHVMVGRYDSSALPGQTLNISASAITWVAGRMQIPISVCSPSCPPGFRKAAREGKPICCFQCVSCPHGEISNQTDSSTCSTCPWDQWPNDKQDQCIPKVIEFLSYEDPIGGTLAATSTFSSIIPVAILGLFLYYRNTPIIRANNRSLSYLLLLSLSVSFLCSLAFIGYPTQEKCLIRQAAFGITFVLCVTFILAKTTMVVIAFNATKPNNNVRKWVGPHLSYTIIGVGTLIKVILCISWITLAPPFPQFNIHTQPGKIIVECNEGSSLAFWGMLGYLGLLATICFIMAFLARNLPDSFNEAKFITFSMLAFLSVWLSFIPAYLSTHGKYMVAMEVFAILSSSSALVSCIFFPKCYIILMRPDMNTKEYLMGRVKGKRKKRT